jgi:hypothetical protein
MTRTQTKPKVVKASPPPKPEGEHIPYPVQHAIEDAGQETFAEKTLADLSQTMNIIQRAVWVILGLVTWIAGLLTIYIAS